MTENTDRKDRVTRSKAVSLLAGASAIAIFAASPTTLLAQVETVAETQPSNIAEMRVIGDPVGLLEDRPTDSVFGFGRSNLETPRSISIISDTTIDRYAIQDIDDFITTTPGTFGGSFFGVPGSITIRGAISETYFRGFKRALNQGLFPTPVGSAERVEIVRGPVPVIYGAGRVGGFLNFYPAVASGEGKSPADGPSGSVSVTGGSYERANVTGELFLPFLLDGRDTGVSIYAEYEDSESFYRGREPQHELVQIAATHDLGGGWSLEFGGMYFNSDGYYQTPGWNRVTQDLIDNGTYVTGVDTDITDINGDGQLNPAELDAVVGAAFGSSNIRTFVDFGVFGFPDAYALDEGVGTTTLDERTVFISDQEITRSESLVLYGDLIKEMDNGTAKLQFFYDAVDGEINVTYGFAAEHVMDVYEVRGSYDFGFEVNDLIDVDVFTTSSYRYYDSELREHFLGGYLVLDRRDISAGATATDIFATPLTDPNLPWDTNIESDWSDLGAGVVVDTQFADKVSVIVGGRFDHYAVDATDAGAVTFGAPTLADVNQGDFSYSASLSYKSDVGVVPYVTFAEGAAPEYNANGGISPAQAADGEFLSDSQLFEAGVKFALFDGSLNGSVAYYDQERTRQDAFGNLDEETSEGVEIEVRYLVTDNLTLTGAATFQDFEISAPGECGSGNGEFVVIAPTHPSVNAFGQTITGAEGYGGLFAALNASCLPELSDGYDRNTIPETVWSVFATYTSDPTPFGLTYGGTLGATYVSETGGKTEGAVVYPDYTLVRAAAFGQVGRFGLTATVENLFDERYFQPVQGVYEEVAALPGQGRLVFVTGRVSF